MPYTVACPAGLMGKTGRMTVEQLQEMAHSGVTVACHTMTETDMEQDTPKRWKPPCSSLKQRCAAGASAGAQLCLCERAL